MGASDGRSTRRMRRGLLAWYDTARRDLPWRGIDDPYAIWVSEVMCQQTRVETAIPYFLRWMARFPDVATLAAADEEEVLRLWQGLGYYRRARMLHQGACHLVAEHDGTLPRDAATLRTVPGIGAYTAGAIASIAFGEAVPAVDGNVLRVLARIGLIEEDVLKGAGKRAVTDLAARLVDPERPGDWNQAVMELGATLCTPRSPTCGACPLEQDCSARATGAVDRLPVRTRRAEVATVDVRFALVEQDDRILLVKNPREGLLGGLWGLPGGPVEAGPLEDVVAHQTGIRVRTGDCVGRAEHRFTHRHWKIAVHEGQPGPEYASVRADAAWVPWTGLSEYPLSTAITKAIAATGRFPTVVR